MLACLSLSTLPLLSLQTSAPVTTSAFCSLYLASSRAELLYKLHVHTKIPWHTMKYITINTIDLRDCAVKCATWVYIPLTMILSFLFLVVPADRRGHLSGQSQSVLINKWTFGHLGRRSFKTGIARVRAQHGNLEQARRLCGLCSIASYPLSESS